MPDNGLGELERLTIGETLLIDRRRRDESQADAAKRLKLTHSMYGKWEREIVPGTRAKVLPLKGHERCLLYRHRSNDTQEKVAKDLKFCRWWVNQMERGVVPCDDLICYWEQ